MELIEVMVVFEKFDFARDCGGSQLLILKYYFFDLYFLSEKEVDDCCWNLVLDVKMVSFYFIFCSLSVFGNGE